MDELEAVKASAAYAQDVTQLALVVIGGTVAVLLGSSHLRPPSRVIRWSYFLFVPGWAFLGMAIYFGIQVKQGYLAYLWQAGPKGLSADMARAIGQSMNTDATRQITYLQVGLATLAVWMLVYLCWWILRADNSERGGNDKASA